MKDSNGFTEYRVGKCNCGNKISAIIGNFCPTLCCIIVGTRINCFIFWLLLPVLLFSQEPDNSDINSYLTEQGYIIPPDEVKIENFITQVDYDYPLPLRDPINVITAADIKGNTAYMQIGLRGRKTVFQELPSMNIVFVIDKSGSMLEQNKMDWVKDSLQGFIEQIREQDVVSLIVFDTGAQVLISPTQVKTELDKQQFIKKVNAIQPSGGTNIYEGMRLGYNQALANCGYDYINQVICLTDGVHNSGGRNKMDILRLAERFKKQDIMTSTIALGTSADINLMADTALTGGGTFRFISEHTDMVQSFGADLDRLVIPAAKRIKMELRLGNGIIFKETWGYENRFADNTIYYTLDTIHNGDAETIVAEVQINLKEPADLVLGNFYVEYLDQSNSLVRQGPYPIVLEAASPAGTAF
jgi:Ca-activated chloride channel family protein